MNFYLKERESKFLFLILFISIYIIFNNTSLLSQEDTSKRDFIIYANNIDGYAPYSIIPKDDKLRPYGISQDIIDEITNLYGIEIRNEKYPEKRNQLYLTKGLIDAKSKAKEWVKEPNLFYWSDPYIDITNVIMYLKSKPLKIDTIEDLLGKTIGSRLGYRYQLFAEYFDQKKIFRHDSKNNVLLFKMLAAEKTDAVIVNKTEALWTIKENPEFYNLFEFSELKVGTAGYRFVFTKKYDWRPFIKFVNEELKRMKKDGRFNEILNRYK